MLLPGINAKMNEAQAAMGLCNLELVEDHMKKRKRIYETYTKILSQNKSISFQGISAEKYNYSYMPVCLKNKISRDRIYEKLIKNGIKPRKYFYPLTIDAKFFKKNPKILKQKRELVNARDVSNRILCLPMYSSLSMKLVRRIANVIINEA